MIRLPRWLALGAVALCCVACTSSSIDTPSPNTAGASPATSIDPPTTIDPAAPINEYEPLSVEQLTLVDDSTIEVVVARPCGERLTEVIETPTSVDLRLLDKWDPAPNEDCGLEYSTEIETIVLDGALADRTLVVRVPWWVIDEERSNDPCFLRPPSRICRDLTIQFGDERRTVDARPVGRRPVAIDPSAGLTDIGLSNDWRIDLSAPNWPADAVIVNTRSLFQPSEGVHGSVAIHNIERNLDELDAVDDILGYPAHAIRPPQSDGREPARGVTIDTGEWFIDIIVYANPPEEDAQRLATLLSNLTIEERPGHLPLVADRLDWISDRTELIVTDPEQSGFTLAFAIECEEDTASCRPGVGYVSPGGGYESSVSEVPASRWPLTNDTAMADIPRAVDEIEVAITSFGERYPLVECTGIPWYEPALLPQGLPLIEAERENFLRSGIRNWTWRSRPGERSGHTGSALEPEAVARFTQRADGQWDVTSATRCQ